MNMENETTPRQAALRAAESIKTHAPDLNVRVCGAWVWIAGNTYPHRSLLKFAGCKWSAHKEQWYAAFKACASRRSHPYFYIREKYGETEVKGGASC